MASSTMQERRGRESNVTGPQAVAAADSASGLSLKNEQGEPCVRIGYRLRQFWRGLRASVSTEELVYVRQILPLQAFELFQRMPTDAQRHSLDVFYLLKNAGYSQAELLIAALLHDAGKVATDAGTVSLSLWLRGPLVIAERAMPALIERLAMADPDGGWRYLLHVQRNHAEIGAQWADEAGCNELACWLIARHQDNLKTYEQQGVTQNTRDAALERIDLLRALQWADGQV